MGKRVHRRTTIALISAAVAVAVLALIAVPRIYLASAPVVVTYRHDAGTQNAASSAWAKRVEQLCRCQVTWRDVLSDSKEWTTRVRYGDISSYLSGELGVPVPDILINIDSPERYYARPLNRSARYLDLRQYMDRMPNVSKYFHSEPEAWLVAQGDDGTVRSIPGDAGDDYDGSLSHMLINRVWLDKVGMSTPQTWDELLDVLRAFRDRDPNGNGKHDEIPMLFSPQADIELGNGLKELPSGWPLLLNSTGIATQLGESALGWSGFYVDHGTVKNYAGSDNLKRVGDYLSRLSSEQLISKDSFSGAYKVQQWNEQAKQDMENGHLEGIYDSESDAAVNDHSAAARPALNAAAQVVPASTSDTAKADTRAGYAELLSSDTPVVGVAFVQDASAFAANANQYQSIPIPAEYAGATVTWDRSNRARFNLNALMVNAQTPRLEATLRVVDALYDLEVSIGQYYGDHTTLDGDTLTVDKDANGYGRQSAGWIPSSLTIVGDTARDLYRQADEPYHAIYAAMGNDSQFPTAIAPAKQDTDDTDLLGDNDMPMMYYINTMIYPAWSKAHTDFQWRQYLQQQAKVIQDNEQRAKYWQDRYLTYERRSSTVQ